MYNLAFYAHFGVRYLVLLFGVLSAFYALVGMIRKTPVDNKGLTLLRVFTVLIDVQILFGVLMVISGVFYGALMGHITMMIAAAAVAHLGTVRLKKAEPPARSYGLMLATSVIPLALIVGGILAIQRAII